MDNSKKTKPLKAFLRAALQKRRENAGLAAIASNVTQAVAGNPFTGAISKVAGFFNPNTCVDPFVDDAESYDCECLGEMVWWLHMEAAYVVMNLAKTGPIGVL